jgi:hypothetical protein
MHGGCVSGLISKTLTLCIKCFVKNSSKCVFVVIFISKLSGYCATPSVNTLTPELNPSMQCSLPRFLLGILPFNACS